jgi:hypothetical protein
MAARVDATSFIACQDSNVVERMQNAASLRGAAKRKHAISFLTVNSPEPAATACLFTTSIAPPLAHKRRRRWLRVKRRPVRTVSRYCIAAIVHRLGITLIEGADVAEEPQKKSPFV